jgi:hypothetical protein
LKSQSRSDKVNRLFGDLSPLPPSLDKGRGSVGKRGASPLSKISFPSIKEGKKESQREAVPLLRKTFSPHDRNTYPYHGEGDTEGEVDKQSHIVRDLFGEQE